MDQAPFSFAPQLAIPSGVKDVSFYSKAFGAVLRNVWKSDDDSIHVAEFSIGNATFYLHQENAGKNFIKPEGKGTSVIIGLFADNIDEITTNAVSAGAILLSPPQDYEYGYRQSEIKDPFGHLWLLQKKNKIR